MTGYASEEVIEIPRALQYSLMYIAICSYFLKVAFYVGHGIVGLYRCVVSKLVIASFLSYLPVNKHHFNISTFL